MFDYSSIVPIPCQELEELKRQSEEINRKIKELSCPKGFAVNTSLKPLSSPINLKNDEPVFGYTENYYDRDAWKSFIYLGKSIHEKIGQFYMDSAYGFNYYRRPYIRKTKNIIPKTIAELTDEQIRISCQMINELVEIYNRYYAMLHTEVVYDPNDGSGPLKIKVLSPSETKEFINHLERFSPNQKE